MKLGVCVFVKYDDLCFVAVSFLLPKEVGNAIARVY